MAVVVADDGFEGGAMAIEADLLTIFDQIDTSLLGAISLRRYVLRPLILIKQFPNMLS